MLLNLSKLILYHVLRNCIYLNYTLYPVWCIALLNLSKSILYSVCSIALLHLSKVYDKLSDQWLFFTVGTRKIGKNGTFSHFCKLLQCKNFQEVSEGAKWKLTSWRFRKCGSLLFYNFLTRVMAAQSQWSLVNVLDFVFMYLSLCICTIKKLRSESVWDGLMCWMLALMGFDMRCQA